MGGRSGQSSGNLGAAVSGSSAKALLEQAKAAGLNTPEGKALLEQSKEVAKSERNSAQEPRKETAKQRAKRIMRNQPTTHSDETHAEMLRRNARQNLPSWMRR
jgi:hypothetical protein